MINGKIGISETDPHKYGTLKYNQDAIADKWGKKELFNKGGWTINYPYEKMKIDSYLRHTKNQF